MKITMFQGELTIFQYMLSIDESKANKILINDYKNEIDVLVNNKNIFFKFKNLFQVIFKKF